MQLVVGTARTQGANAHDRLHADVELEREARLYLSGDYEGKFVRTQDAAGSEEPFIYGGFRNKNREFIEFFEIRRRRLLVALPGYIEDDAGMPTILAQDLNGGA